MYQILSLRCFVACLLISMVPTSGWAKTSTGGYATSEALIKNYLSLVQHDQFDQFYAMTIHSKYQQVWEEIKKQKQEQSYQVTFDRIKKQMHALPYEKSTTLFKAQQKVIPKTLNWRSFTSKKHLDCTEKTLWSCSRILTFTTPQSTLKFFIDMYKIQQKYYLATPIIVMKKEMNTPTDISPVEHGKHLYKKLACMACHSTQKGVRKIGPSLFAIYKSTLQSTQGTQKVVDEEHLKNSLINPRSFVVAGYAPSMPSYKGRINEQQMKALLAYLKSL